MTGPYDACLGMNKEAVISRFLTQMPTRFEVPKEGRTTLSGTLVDIDPKTGVAKRIERIVINEDHPLQPE